MEKVTLDKMCVGEAAEIIEMNVAGEMRRRMQDLGFIEGNLVRCMLKARSGEPTAFMVCGALIALREEEMRMIAGIKRPFYERSCDAWG